MISCTRWNPEERMILREFQKTLEAFPGHSMHWLLPDGDMIPAHYHITEVGKVQKDFVDCGGTARSVQSCLLQIWVANDTDHRLASDKLLGILRFAQHLLTDPDLNVEIEYEQGSICQFAIMQAEATPAGILFHLGNKHTACLAPDRCGIPGITGCC